MQEYTTYVYEKSKKKATKRLFYNLGILAALCAVIYMFVAGILGIGLSIIGAIGLIVTIIQMTLSYMSTNMLVSPESFLVCITEATMKLRSRTKANLTM